MKNEEAHEQIQQQEKQRQALETWAANRIKSWEKLNPDDYDFQSWANEAKKNCLSAGAVYEYARESRKLRCLLTLTNPKRPREDWEMVRPAIVDGKQPDPSDPLAKPRPFPCSFNGLDEHAAERALGGFLCCLRDLAGYLADNISFGELFRTKRDELETAFGGLDELARAKRAFRYFLPVADAVEVATQSEAQRVTVEETVSDDQRRIILGETHSEVIAVRIRWHFTNSEIAAGMRKLVRTHRPRNQAYKPRQRKKGSRQSSFRSALDCLSAMRLASYFPKTSPPHAKAIIDAADKRNWENVRQELDRTQNSVQQAMNEVHDEKLSQLVSLGGWLRGTEVLTSVVKQRFSTDGAELLHQPDLLSYFQTRLQAMPSLTFRSFIKFRTPSWR